MIHTYATHVSKSIYKLSNLYRRDEQLNFTPTRCDTRKFIPGYTLLSKAVYIYVVDTDYARLLICTCYVKLRACNRLTFSDEVRTAS